MEAQQNSDVKTTLLPIAIDTTRAMNVVFPDDKVSEVSGQRLVSPWSILPSLSGSPDLC